MPEKNSENFSWDKLSVVLIFIYGAFQVLRWRFFPQFMDSYYHLLTAWGFNQAGGVSAWDFWQFAPVGRPHIYPPFFHIILAGFMKLGIGKIMLARIFEAFTPVIFLIIIWRFVRINFSARFAFWVLIALSSSFSFFLCLSNNLPATLALILGILAFDELFAKRILRCSLLLALCFYTHVGVSWVIAVTLLIYGLLTKEPRKFCLTALTTAIILALPLLYWQVSNLKFITLAGATEKYFSEFKTIDYLLAFLGLYLAWKNRQKYRLFIALFAASFIFLAYPYRFFSAQGYLPVIFLSALALDYIYGAAAKSRPNLKILVLMLGCFIFFISPTILMSKNGKGTINYKTYFFDSASMNLAYPGQNDRIAAESLYFSTEYLASARLIDENSLPGDIIFCDHPLVGVCLAGLSERPTANGLFQEASPVKKINPVAVSRIIILSKDKPMQRISDEARQFGLNRIGENEMFVLYVNPASRHADFFRKAAVPFGWIALIALVWLGLFFIENIKKLVDL